MLKLNVKGTEYYNSKTNSFLTIDSETLILEHSLISLTKWEAIYKKSFLDTVEKGWTPEEALTYIRCMAVEEPKDDNIFLCITAADFSKIEDYIGDKYTATSFMDLKKKTPMGKKEVITSELIYYWMIESDIPFECDKWNLNHLIALIRVVQVKRSNTKMPHKERDSFNKALMAKRRAGK